MMMRFLSVGCVSVAATLALVLSGSAHATGASPGADPLGVIHVHKGEPIEVGGYWALSGPAGARGEDAARAVRVAIAAHHDELLGHPIKFHVINAPCTAQGGGGAANELAAVPGMTIVLGPACSEAAKAAAPILWQDGIVNIATGGEASELTAADRGPRYDGFARTAPSDDDQAIADARYLRTDANRKTAVAIYDETARSEELAHIFAAAFAALGGKVLAVQAVPSSESGMHAMLMGVAEGKAGVLYMPVAADLAAQVLRDAKGLPRLSHTIFYGGSALMTPKILAAAGPSVVGLHVGYRDVSASAMGKAYPAFAKAYEKMFGSAPTSSFYANAYDAATLAFTAIEAAAKSGSDGSLTIGKTALRDAVFAAKFEGASGPIACDQFGACAKLRAAAYAYVSAAPKSFKIGVNPKRVWP